MKKLHVLLATLAVGLLFAAVGQAETPAATTEAGGCDGPALEEVFGPSTITLAAMAPSDEQKPGDTPEASCVADCKNGTTVACWGSSCSAYDRNCPSTRGYCYGSSTGYRYCNPPCGCSATASCAQAGGGSVSCSGSSGCFAVDNCYAYCNGTYHWCPNPKHPCPV